MKTLVLFYSYSGTTKKIAQWLAELTKGEVRELIPEKQYSFDYNTAVKEIRLEMERGYCPKLLAGNEPVEEYDCIFIGSPNWLGTFAPPVLSFLRNADLSRKTVVPFCTHGGGGFGKMEKDMEAECKCAKLLPGGAFSAKDTKESVAQWLQASGLMNE